MGPHHSRVSSAARVLVVAGSDSSAAAGVQADIKTVSALGGYATTAVTAVTAQSTAAVTAVHPVPAEVVAVQMSTVLDDIGADAVKTGMLCSSETITAVARVLREHARGVPVVVDPVMLSTSGSRLLAEEGVAALRRELLPLCRLVTPNVPEAKALTGVEVHCEDDMRRAADALLALGAESVLIKGGHLPGRDVVDVLFDGANAPRRFVARRQDETPRGTGCTLASGIATMIARGEPLESAVKATHDYLQRAIRAARPMGAGPRLLDHDPPD